jgi:hypothetical protein
MKGLQTGAYGSLQGDEQLESLRLFPEILTDAFPDVLDK